MILRNQSKKPNITKEKQTHRNRKQDGGCQRGRVWKDELHNK